MSPIFQTIPPHPRKHVVNLPRDREVVRPNYQDVSLPIVADVISFGVPSVSHQGNREKQQPDQRDFVLVLYGGPCA
jgi:hypothetical protein